VTGNFPEEDDVDHRVEPQSWLPEGAAEDQDQAAGEPPQDDMQSALAGLAASGNMSSPAVDAGHTGSTTANGATADDATVDGARLPPPYPSMISQPNAATGRATSSFGTITSPGKPPGGPKPQAAKISKAQAARQAQNGRAPARRATLAVTRVEPWSVMKFSFMISLVGWVVLFVAVAALYFVLSRVGVFVSIERSIADVTSSKQSPGVQASNWFSASRVLGYTMLIGAVNVILITALATVGSVIYNLVTHIAGGIEVTLRETD
jgi:hypothetical protein